MRSLTLLERDAALAGAPMSEVGSRFHDYELTQEIARGGMGVVYRARQLSLNRTVALKMILAGEFASEADVDRFRVEAEAAASLEHPFIVPIYEIGESEGRHFFSMKLVEGDSLANGIERMRDRPREGVLLLSKVCRAVHHAHQRGILHRDLKPANILIDQQGDPHVTDFGLAKRTEGDPGLTQTGVVLGTPSYMSPEQAAPAGQPLTTAVDVYSLGAILYEMLTGRAPFEGASAVAVVMQVLGREPDRPRAVHPAADVDLETIALKCLEKDPSRRYGSAEALADELDRWLAYEPILARPISSATRVLKWMRRRPAVAGLTCALGLAVCMGAIGIVWQSQIAIAQRDRAVAARAEATALAALEARARSSAEAAAASELTARNHEAEQRAIAERALRQAEANLYVNSLELADRECAAQNVAHADQLLGGAPVALRGWEWHYLSRLCHMEHAVLGGGDGTALALRVGTAREAVIALTNSMMWRRWDPETLREIGRGRVNHDTLMLAQGSRLSPDGRLFAALHIVRPLPGVIRGTITVMSVATGADVRTLRAGESAGEYVMLAFSPNSRRLYAVRSERAAPPAPLRAFVEAWTLDGDTESAPVTLAEFTGGPSCLEVSPDGRSLALTAGASLTVIDIEIRERRMSLPITACRALAFSHDGSALALSTPTGVALLDAASGSIRKSWPAAASNVAFSPDDRRIAVALPDRTIRVLEAGTGTELAALTGHPATIQTLEFSPDGARIFSGGTDGAVRVWELRPPPSPRRVGSDSTAAIRGVGLSDDSRTLFVVTETGFRCYDASTRATCSVTPPGEEWFISGREVQSSRDGAIALVQTMIPLRDPNGAISAHHAANRLDIASGTHVTLRSRGLTGMFVPAVEAKGSSPLIPGGTATIALSPAGNRAALVTSIPLSEAGLGRTTGARIELWDPRDARSLAVISLPDHEASSLRFTDDGRRAAYYAVRAGTGSWILRIIDATTGTELWQMNWRSPLAPIAFTRAGDRMAVPRASGAGIWDVGTGVQLATIPPHPAAIQNLAFNRAGSRLATVTSDGTVRLWNATAGTSLVTLGASSGPFTEERWFVVGRTLNQPRTLSLAFSADDLRITSTIIERQPGGVSVVVRTWDGSPRDSR